MDSVQVRQVLADLQFNVRNYKANRNGKSWAWSCDICGDSQVNKRKARFGLAHKDNAYVVHCFNCGYSNTFVGYLKSYHPNMYERVTVDDFVNSLDMYDLNRLFTKVSNKTLHNIFFINKFRNAKYWLDYLQRKNIRLKESNLRELYKMHKEYWNA